VSREWERVELRPLIVLEPARWEQRSDEIRAAYDALAEDIAQLGFEVEIEVPEVIEYRNRTANELAPLADLVVYVKDAVEDHVLDLVVGAILARVGASVRSKWPRKREVAILAPDGETVLRRVKLSDPEDAS
jgi:Asp-tRNA(Asn)/Glu-tRNA(Gln) amidotransferase A subunit family amidase